MYAYDKLYLEKARTALGRMLDFAVYDLKYDFTDFLICLSLPVLLIVLSRVTSQFWLAGRESSWLIWFSMRSKFHMNV